MSTHGMISCASIRKQKKFRYSHCLQEVDTPTSTPPSLTVMVCSGLQDRTASMAGLNQQPEIWRSFPCRCGRGPYGITTTPDGSVYYASLANSYVGRIDPQTGEATILEPPTSGTGRRRVWSDSQGKVWVSEWNAGQVAVYDPANNSWQEWKLPGDRPQAYAVYVDDHDIVWLSDFGANALVRFDPRLKHLPFSNCPAHPRRYVKFWAGRAKSGAAESGVDKLVVIRASSSNTKRRNDLILSHSYRRAWRGSNCAHGVDPACAFCA